MGPSQPEEAARGRGAEVAAVLDGAEVEKAAGSSLCVRRHLAGGLGLLAARGHGPNRKTGLSPQRPGVGPSASLNSSHRLEMSLRGAGLADG